MCHVLHQNLASSRYHKLNLPSGNAEVVPSASTTVQFRGHSITNTGSSAAVSNIVIAGDPITQYSTVLYNQHLFVLIWWHRVLIPHCVPICLNARVLSFSLRSFHFSKSIIVPACW
jgi:hypothetical protein